MQVNGRLDGVPTIVASGATDIGRSTFYPNSGLPNTFRFKIQDKQGIQLYAL